MAGFGDRVIERERALGHPLCVGLDPYLDRIPSLFRRGTMTPRDPDTALAVEEFCCRVIDLIAADVAVVKPQVSLFERLGWRGWQALERVIRHARSAGPLVAASLAKWQERLVGGKTGWSSLGVTVAATRSGDTERIRVALPHALFLVLGYGAQGASAGEAVRGALARATHELGEAVA